MLEPRLRSSLDFDRFASILQDGKVDQYDVAIVGGGMVGMALACSLGKLSLCSVFGYSSFMQIVTCCYNVEIGRVGYLGKFPAIFFNNMAASRVGFYFCLGFLPSLLLLSPKQD